MATGVQKSSPARPAGDRSILRRRLLGVSFLGLLLVWFAPVLVAHTPLRQWLARKMLPGLHGTVSIGQMSAGWFWPVVLEQVTVRDLAEQTVLAVARVESTRTLLGLLTNPRNPGSFRLEKPDLHLVFSEQSSNVEDLLESLQSGRNPGRRRDREPSDASLDLQVEGVDARIVVKDAPTGHEWLWDTVNVSLSLSSEPGRLLRVSVQGTVFQASSSTAKIDAELLLGNRSGRRGELKAELEHFPLALAAPILRRLEPGNALHGQVDGKLHYHWDLKKGEKNQSRLDAQVVFRDLSWSSPQLGDEVRLAKLEIPLRLALAGSQLHVDQAAVICDVGEASFKGDVDLDRLALLDLAQPGWNASLNLDLPKAVHLLPNTLRLRQGTKLEAGCLNLNVKSVSIPEGVAWEGVIHATPLRGIRDGQVIDWPEPVQLLFKGRLKDGDIFTIDQLLCDSKFLRLAGAGSVQQWSVRADLDLERLAEPLARFFSLGDYYFGGQGWIELAVCRPVTDGFRLEGRAELRRLQVPGLTGTSWPEDLLRVSGEASGKRTAAGPVLETGKLTLAAGTDSASIELREPLAMQRPSACLDVRIQGDVARWQDRLQGWVGSADALRLAGTGSLVGQLRLTPPAYYLEQAALEWTNASCSAPGLWLKEPSVDVKASVCWRPTEGSLEIRDARLDCTSLNLRSPQILVERPGKGVPSAAGRVHIEGNLGKLRRWFLDPDDPKPEPLDGMFQGNLEAAAEPGRAKWNIGLVLTNVVYGTKTSPWLNEPRIEMQGNGRYDFASDQLVLEPLQISNRALTLDTAGVIAQLLSKPHIDLQGRVTYDLAKLEPALRPHLGKDVRLRGEDERSFKLAGPLTTNRGRLSLAALAGDGSLGWKTLHIHGANVGPAELKAHLEQGWLRLSAIDTTVNKGRLHVEPLIKLEPGPATFFTGKGAYLHRASVTPEMCRGFLGYAVPLLAGVTEADGKVSLTLDWTHVPLENPAKADIGGKLTIHSARIGVSPLLRELAVLFRTSEQIKLSKEAVVTFRVVDGKVHHQNLELVFPDFWLRTQGWVGLDGSLSLLAELPVPSSWLPASPLGKALAKQTLRVPIRGTLDRPRLDAEALRSLAAQITRDAAGDLLRQELENRWKNLTNPEKR